MHVLILSGSRDPSGQTARAAEALGKGLSAEGATHETIFLTECAIERCRQCDEKGWGDCRTVGSCIIEDDLAELMKKMAGADAVVFATPVYYGDLAESMRALLDRVRRVAWHHPERAGLKGKAAVTIAVAGGGGGGAPNCLASFDRMLGPAGFDAVDAIACRRQNLDAKLGALELTGRWLARGRPAAAAG